jgi:Tol biopolymer transport system component
MRVIYAPGPGSPLPELSAWSKDGKTIYFKSHDAAGRASIWSVPAAGGKPRLLVHFDDLDKPSFRPSFSTDEKRIYVSVEDRQSDVFVAELVRK